MVDLDLALLGDIYSEMEEVKFFPGYQWGLLDCTYFKDPL